MTPKQQRWNELQMRWAAGEALRPEEEQARLELAQDDVLAQREFELLAELRDKLAVPDAADSGLYDGVLEHVGAVEAKAPGRLRLVSPDERPSPAPSPPVARTTRWPAGRWILALAAVTLSVAVLWFARAQLGQQKATVAQAPAVQDSAPTRVELVLASGEVQLAGRDVVVGQSPLERGQRISVSQGRACITVDPAIDVCLGDRSEIALDSLIEGSVRIRVLRGTAVAALAPRAPGQTFSLVGGDVSATARGTIFAVDHSPDENATNVVVVDGKVEVSRGERPAQMLTAHSKLTADRASQVGKTTWVGRSDEAQLLSLIAQRNLWQTKELGTLEIAGANTKISATIGEEAPLAVPLRAFVPAGKHRVLLRDASGNQASLDVEIATGEKRQINATDVMTSPSKASPPATKASAAELLDAARRELARAGGKAALPLYRRLRSSYPGSPEAFTVLVTMGRLELDVGSPARSLAAFDAYLRRGGPLAPEALAGKIRALRALSRRNEERQAIEHYLANYPNGFDAPALKQRLEVLSAP